MHRSGRPDIGALVAGIALVALGVPLLLDRLGAVDLGFPALAPIVCACLGAILLAGGLSRQG